MSDSPFPIAPPIEPMLAKLADELPPADGFLFEPKWDGFRAIVFRGGGDVFIQSRDLRPLRPLLSRAARRAARRPPRRLRGGRRDRHRHAGRARLRRAADAACTRRRRASRSWHARSPRPSSRSTCWPPDGADLREAPQERAPVTTRAPRQRGSGTDSPDADDARPRGRGGVARPVRGRRPRRRDGQAARRRLSARQARDAQDQARAHRRLRGGRLPLAQGRPRRAGGLAPARALRRPRTPAPRRRHLGLHDGHAAGAGAGARAAARARARRSPLARVGGSHGRRQHAHARRPEPVERRQGSVVGAAADRARVRGEVRPYAGRPLPARGGVRAVAARSRSRATAATTSSRSRRLTSSRRSSARGRPRRPASANR